MNSQPSSPKATGGAGTIFEYRLAALMFSRLLRGAYVPVGIHLPLGRVGLQQRVTGHTLDDIVAYAKPAPHGPRIQMQVKQKIHIRGKDSEFIKVMAAALQARKDHAQDIADGAMLLGLAAGEAVTELAELEEIAGMARVLPDHNAMRLLLSENVTLRRLRTRYDHVVTAVSSAASVDSREEAECLAHQVLSALHVWPVDIGLDGRDSRAELDHLAALLSEDEVRATDVFAHLCEIAQEYGPRAGQLDAEQLRRLLRSRYGIRLHTKADLAAPSISRPLLKVCQLPAEAPHFRGREDELKRLDEFAALVTSDRSESSQVAVIVGKPGVGKTSLAVRAATELRDRFEEAQLFVDLRGVDKDPVDPAEALSGFLRALGIDDSAIPAQLEERAAMFRSTLADRRIIVVLDNAANVQQVQHLLPGAGPSLAIVTSRDNLVGLAGGCQISLEVLSIAEAVDLLALSTSRPELRRDPNVAEIAHLCGRLPLALRVIASTIVGYGRWSTRQLVQALRDEQDRLDQLSPGDIGVRASISLSYRRLSAQTRKIFRMLSAIPGSRFNLVVASAAVGEDKRVTKRRLEELVNAHLVDRAQSDGLYQFHDLIRLFSSERLADEEEVSVVSAAEFRLIKQILTPAVRAGRSLTPEGLASLTPEEVKAAEGGENLLWLDTNWSLVRGSLNLLVKHHLDGDLMQSIRDLGRYVQMRDLWSSWVDLAASVTSTASRLGIPEFQVAALAMLADAQTHLRDIDGATSTARELKALLTSVTTPLLRADALNSLGNALRLIQQTDDALACFEESHRLFGECDSMQGQSISAHNIASVHRDCGRYDDAIRFYELDLAYCRESGDRWYEAWTLNSLGGAYEAAGELDQAIDAHVRAYGIFYACGDKAFVSRCLHDLGLALGKIGRIDAATRCHIADLVIGYERGDLRGIAMAFGCLGRLAIGVDNERAATYLDQAKIIAHAVGDADAEGSVLVIKGEVALLEKDPEAVSYIETGLDIVRKGGLPQRHAYLMMSAGSYEELPRETRVKYLSDAIRIFDHLGDRRESSLAGDLLKKVRGGNSMGEAAGQPD